jgi:hypothetical protein
MGLLLLPMLPWCRAVAVIPVALALALYSSIQRMAPRLRHPEVAFAAGVVCVQALLTTAVVLNHSQHDAGLIILIWPVVAAGSRFPTRVLWAGAAYTAGLMVFAALAFGGSTVTHDPLLLTLPLAALFSITSMSAVGRD